jgi:hypothetical protein
MHKLAQQTMKKIARSMTANFRELTAVDFVTVIWTILYFVTDLR